MSALRVVAATALDPGPRLELFNACYAGYEVPVHLDEPSFAMMVRLCDLDASRSVVGLEGDQPVAMGMLGLRGALGWIGGMGVTAEARGRGYGTEIMRALIDNARRAGARAVDLEVLVGNAPAIRIYEALGFRKRRRFVVWLIDPVASAAPPAEPPGVVPLEVGAALGHIARWQLGPAPWQRAPETLANLPEPPTAVGLERDGALEGTMVYRAVPERASVLALAARPGEQRTFDALLGVLRARHPEAVIRMLNMQDDDPGMAAFERLGARAEARQHEMRLSLQGWT
jgi:ribosomal protein S18 acetylase RimI-like enzyme